MDSIPVTAAAIVGLPGMLFMGFYSAEKFYGVTVRVDALTLVGLVLVTVAWAVLVILVVTE